MQLDGVELRAGGEGADAFDRERTQRDPSRFIHLREHDPQPVVHAQLVVAVGRDDQRFRTLEPPAEVEEEVERRLVCPVDVLQNDEGRSSCELVERCGEDLARLPLRAQAQVVERRERLGREEPVAARPQDADIIDPRGELAEERRLPDPGFAAHDDEPSAVSRVGKLVGERLESGPRSSSRSAVMP